MFPKNLEVLFLIYLSDLDYRFGWRWLLPSCSGPQAVYFGLTHEEQRWWSQTIATQSLKGASSPTEGCLIALDHCDISSVADIVNGMYPSWLCAWGSGSAISRLRESLGGFRSVHEYALLPADNPRVVVPLSSSKHVIAGLRLHRPGRWVAKFGLLAARGLTKIGYFGLLRRQVLLVATRSSDCPIGVVYAKLCVSMQTEQQDYALYFGVQGDNRKTVVLPVKKNSQPNVILKIAESIKARAALKNEAQALQSLANTSLANQIPKLIGMEDTECSVTLHQEYRARQYMSTAGMSRAAVDFLVALSHLERCVRPLAAVLAQSDLMTVNEARAAGKIAYARVKGCLDALAESGVMIWSHRSHGDFAPWNCSWTTKGFFVFDWEMSQPWAIALDDAFYYIVAPSVHVMRSPNTRKVEASAFKFAMLLVKKADLPIENISIYWLLWLLQRINRQPDGLYDRLLEHFVANSRAMHSTNQHLKSSI